MKEAASFKKRPVVVQAIQWTGVNSEAVLRFIGSYDKLGAGFNEQVVIYTLEGIMKAQVGDFIIKGVEGEVYPCKPSIFNKTYIKEEVGLPFVCEEVVLSVGDKFQNLKGEEHKVKKTAF